DAAIDKLSSARGQLGAQNNALEHVTANLNVQSENQASARSQIADLDYAKGIVEQTRDQILSQMGTAVLAHANLNSQSVLRLPIYTPGGAREWLVDNVSVVQAARTVEGASKPGDVEFRRL